MILTAESTRALALRFDRKEAACRQSRRGIEVDLPVPVLAGPREERLAAIPATASDVEVSLEKHGTFSILRHPTGLAGVCVCPADRDLELRAYECYRDLFDILRADQHAYRIWHYVPDINGSSGGLENYRHFNIGRRRAFDEAFGPRAETRMPAASAVGIPTSDFVMAFVSGPQPPRYLENPRQTPAYHYPDCYGPKSPSFARAAKAHSAVYISGTASILGHESVHKGDLPRQFSVTAENLGHLAATLGLGSWEEVAALPDYRLKVYLRHAEDLPRIHPLLKDQLQASPDNTMILLADICRADLDLEIEASFLLR